MISIIITAYKEEKTIGRAIEQFAPQIKKSDELIVVCPDDGTAKVVKTYQKKNKNLKLFRDQTKKGEKKGKPNALNLAFKKAKGNILILTDGDVYADKNAVKELTKPFQNKKIGAVSGRPVSVNKRNSVLGYWSHLLTDVGAHATREKRTKKGRFIVCTGYLYAIRSGIIKSISAHTLSDDAVISHLIRDAGYKIGYAPKAKVYVKYPTSWADWVLQKKRSTGGYHQIKDMTQNKDRMRTFWKEAGGITTVFAYAKSIRELWWTVLLIFARLYLWFKIFLDIKVKKEGFHKTWRPVESTK